MSALAPSLILEAVEAMSAEQRTQLVELLGVAMPSPPAAELLTVREAATRANVSEKTIRRRIEDGELAPIRIGSALRVRASDLANLLAATLQNSEPSKSACPRRRRTPTGSAVADAFRRLDR